MTRDCSLNYKKNTSSEHVVYKYCFECQIKKTIFVHNMFGACIFLVITRKIQYTDLPVRYPTYYTSINLNKKSLSGQTEADSE